MCSLEGLIHHGLHALRETLQQDKELATNKLPTDVVNPAGLHEVASVAVDFRILEAPRSRYISTPCSRRKCHRLRPLLLPLQHPLRYQCLQCPLPLQATRTFRRQSRRRKAPLLRENSRHDVLADAYCGVDRRWECSSPPTMYIWQQEISLALLLRPVTKSAVRAHQPEPRTPECGEHSPKSKGERRRGSIGWQCWKLVQNRGNLKTFQHRRQLLHHCDNLSRLRTACVNSSHSFVSSIINH